MTDKDRQLFVAIGEEGLVTFKEASEKLSIDIRTLRSFVKTHKLKVFSLSPRKNFIRLSDVEHIIKSLIN